MLQMLESVACAFGWINPSLGQMAWSPCRADKPQSTRHPSCICVCVFTQKKKKQHWQASCGDDGGWICFGLEYDRGVCLCVCTCMRPSVS